MIDEKEAFIQAIIEYKLQKQYNSYSSYIFDSLDVGILFLEDDCIKFMNKNLKQKLQINAQQDILEMKIFADSEKKEYEFSF